MKQRYLTEKIVQDLKDKMVLVAGPRQVGKTTLAQYISKHYFKPSFYLNWDYQPDRKKIINFQFPGETKLIIYDELHKYKHWKNYLKGIYDKYRSDLHFLVTGSAKLDIYRKGGDSLTGRCFHYILHPFSLAEVLEIKNRSKPFEKLVFLNAKSACEVLRLLFEFGPFPEPFLKQDVAHWRRWQIERTDRLVKEEIRDLRLIGDISSLQILVDTLPLRVASLLSLNNLREDLQVAHKTIVNYLNILELFYFHFRLYPYTKKTIRSLKKMGKLYLWDWSVLENEGAKFENLIASHLLKFVHFLQNVEGYKAQLFYLRDTDGREVDFLLTVGHKPWFAVEVKSDINEPSSSLMYFGKKLTIPQLYQVTDQPKIDFFREKIRVISADKFLTGLV